MIMKWVLKITLGIFVGFVIVIVLALRDRGDTGVRDQSAGPAARPGGGESLMFAAELTSGSMSIPILMTRDTSPRIVSDAAGNAAIEYVLEVRSEGNVDQPRNRVESYEFSAGSVTANPERVVVRIGGQGNTYALSRALRRLLPSDRAPSVAVTLDAAPDGHSPAPWAGEWQVLLGNDGFRASLAACESGAQAACLVRTDFTAHFVGEYWINRAHLPQWPAIDAVIVAKFVAALANSAPEFLPMLLSNAGGEPFDPRAMLATQLGVGLQPPAMSAKIVTVYIGGQRYEIPENYIEPPKIGLESRDGALHGGTIGLFAKYPEMAGATATNADCLREPFICVDALTILLTDAPPLNGDVYWGRIQDRVVDTTDLQEPGAGDLEIFQTTDTSVYKDPIYFLKPRNVQGTYPIFQCRFVSRSESLTSGFCDAKSYLALPGGSGSYWVRFSRKRLPEWRNVLRATENLLVSFRR